MDTAPVSHLPATNPARHHVCPNGTQLVPSSHTALVEEPGVVSPWIYSWASASEVLLCPSPGGSEVCRSWRQGLRDGTYWGRRTASSAQGSPLTEKTPVAPSLGGQCWPVALRPAHLDAQGDTRTLCSPQDPRPPVILPSPRPPPGPVPRPASPELAGGPGHPNHST